MPRSVRFILLWVLGLAGLTFAASVTVRDRTNAWFEKDLDLRARLAINGARAALAAHWDDPSGELTRLLSELTQDERIMGAAVCSMDGATVAQTADFPSALGCTEIAAAVENEGLDPERGLWKRRVELSDGDVHYAALPIARDGVELGYVVLAHDLSFIARRDNMLRGFMIVAFAVLALAASIVTVFASRMSWHDWSEELRRVLRMGGHRKEFQPILSDVRELVDRLLAHGGRAWTPQRLRETLMQQLDGERVIVLANREPYMHQRAEDGQIKVMHPASGLVTAMEPVLRACSGTWVAHGSGTADRETADRRGRLRVPPGAENERDSYVLRRVWLSREEEQGYYYGFANEGLWPLCHIAHTRPTFRAEDWQRYREVNQKFVDAVLEEVEGDDPIVLVQDYHFALAPALIRRRLPRATVIMFWHIPWPNAELFGICPYRDELLEGMLGASILGFHTQFHCNNFLDAIDRYLETRIDRERSAVVHGGVHTLVKPYPISVEWPLRQLEGVPAVADCRASVYAELGLARDVQLGVGVDRLDYTKGIEERLLAVQRMFELQPRLVGRFTFVQLAAPSRTTIARYQQLNDAVEELVERINARFARGAWRPIVLLRAHHEPPTVFRFLRAADVCYVSSLHDGMNLVAKEFVAARDDERGVLVLSQFTGAARELTEALVVNPYNLDEAAGALAAALAMPAREQTARMRSMRAYIAEFNVYGWAGRMLIDAARLRQRERLDGALTHPAGARELAKR